MTDLHITGPNGDGEYWLHIKAGGKMGGFNLGSEHGPLAQRLLNAATIEAPVQEPVAWRWQLCYREEWCWSITKPMFSETDLTTGTVFDVQPLYATPPPDETAALRAKLAEVEAELATVRNEWCADRHGLLADRDEERKLADDLIAIVEGIDGAMNHGTWRDDKGTRLKDTPQWVALYNAARRKEQQG